MLNWHCLKKLWKILKNLLLILWRNSKGLLKIKRGGFRRKSKRKDKLCLLKRKKNVIRKDVLNAAPENICLASVLTQLLLLCNKMSKYKMKMTIININTHNNNRWNLKKKVNSLKLVVSATNVDPLNTHINNALSKSINWLFVSIAEIKDTLLENVPKTKKDFIEKVDLALDAAVLDTH